MMHLYSIIREMHLQTPSVFLSQPIEKYGRKQEFPGKGEASFRAWQDLSDRMTAGDITVPVKHSPWAACAWLSLSVELYSILCLDIGGLPLQHQDSDGCLGHDSRARLVRVVSCTSITAWKGQEKAQYGPILVIHFRFSVPWFSLWDGHVWFLLQLCL